MGERITSNRSLFSQLLGTDWINLKIFLDLGFPSKPWAPNVHLVRVGLVTSENLGHIRQESEGG